MRRIDRQRLKNALTIGAMFFAGMNFAGKFFYFVYFSALVTAFFREKIRINRAVGWYLALGGLMALYNADEGVLSVLRCFVPCVCYLVGLNESRVSVGTRRPMQDCILLVSVASGAFVHFALNALYNLHNLHDTLGRNTLDIWTGTPMAATIQAALAVPMLALATAVLFYPPRKWLRLPMLSILAVTAAYDTVLAVRALPIILLIVLVAGICYVCAHTHRFRLGRAHWAAVIGAVAVIWLYAADVGGLRTKLAATEMAARIGRFWDNSLREQAKRQYLQNLSVALFGGRHLRGRFGYAHDLLLDGYDEYGLLGALLLGAVLVDGGIGLYRFLRHDRADHTCRLMVLLTYIALAAEFTVEPILEAIPWLFCCFCLLNGLMAGREEYERRTLP